MIISLNWLKRYLKIEEYTPEELSDMLTSLGLEVEGIEVVESVKGGLKGLVVGKVLTCEKHENADKLSVTTVDVGEDEPKQIVCGAPNVAIGQKVVVALPGTKLHPTEGDPFVIKESKIRGVASSGMICASDEIGLGEDHSGIMVLEEDAQIGMHAQEYFKLESDLIFSIGLTPNRSDATCHLGVAKDLAAHLIFNKNYQEPLMEPSTQRFHVDLTTDNLDITIDHKDCIRYSGIIVSDLKIGPSPDWIKNSLTSIGVKTINNIVDITNYVLHEYGQPLHAFDADKLMSPRVIITKLANETPFEALDGKVIKLTDEDLMICDEARKPLCIAGVYGGKDSGVTDATTKILLESAHFAQDAIRKSSMRHNLRTDAAKVFEKGSDPNITVLALKRAVALMQEYAGATVTSDIIDVYPKKVEEVEILLRYQRVRDFLGVNITDDEITEILHALGMMIKPISDEAVKVNVPTNKSDVTRDVDLIEEILRIYGFNNITVPDKVKSNINYSKIPDPQKIRNRLTEVLVSSGFYEMMGLSLIESKICLEMLAINESELVIINNTSNITLDTLRPDMMLSGLRTILHNQNRQQSDIKVFEFGKTYKKDNQSFIETPYLSIFMTGASEEPSWRKEDVDLNFYDIKKTVSKILQSIGIQELQSKEINDPRFELGITLHRGTSTLVNFGIVNSKTCRHIGIKNQILYAELDLENIYQTVGKNTVQIKPISKYPSVTRDLALVVSEATKFEEIEKIGKKVSKDILANISLVDVYKNEDQLGKAKKSLAVRFTFESDEKTLTEKELEGTMKNLMDQYTNSLGAVIRH
jgi:phenylalanyl-tRNA synthetase beta chain